MRGSRPSSFVCVLATSAQRNLRRARLRCQDVRRRDVRDVHEADGPGGRVLHAARKEVEQLKWVDCWSIRDFTI